MCALETSRLILRKMHTDDATNFFELNADPEVMKYTGDKPFATIEESKDFLDAYPDYQTNGYGRLTVLLKETGEYIGWCGLKFRKEENATDLGYRIKRKFWNKGYATEASIFCLQYGFEKLNLSFITGRVMQGNEASIKVLEKVGMTFLREKFFYEHPGHYYGIDKKTFLQNFLHLNAM